MFKSFKTYKNCRYPEDVKRIVLICAKHGYFLSPEEAEEAWEAYSDSRCASWLHLHDDKEIWRAVRIYIEEDGDFYE